MTIHHYHTFFNTTLLARKRIQTSLEQFLREQSCLQANELCHADHYQWAMQQPFCQAMLNGNLDQVKFESYIKQDQIYLEHFKACHLSLLQKTQNTEIKAYLKKGINENINAELHSQKSVAGSRHQTAWPLTNLYCEHLVNACEQPNPAIGLAALLPCHWLYAEWTREYFEHHENPNQPYHRFFKLHHDTKLMENAMELRGCIMQAWPCTTAEQHSLSDAYFTSCYFERHFFEGQGLRRHQDNSAQNTPT